jgi:hypothetical protein
MDIGSRVEQPRQIDDFTGTSGTLERRNEPRP